MSERSEPSLLEQLTKPVILASAAAAILTQLWVRLSYDKSLALATALAFALASVGARRLPTKTRRATVFLAFFVPVVFIAVRGEFDSSGWLVWIAALFGLMLQERAALGWALPRNWRLPLAHWGLIGAVGWPIVMLRESDFDLGLIPSEFGALSAAAALVVMTGVLWFDWLYSRYRSGDEGAFRGEILWPMGLGWCVAAVIALWQVFGHVAFLNPPFWSALGRVSGPLADANLFGVVSAMVAPVLVALACDGLQRRGWWWLAFAALPTSWLVTWASGSRSSMVVVLGGVVSTIWGLWRSSGSRRLAIFSSGAVAAIAVVVGLLLTQSQSSIIGPFARFNADFRPRLNADWVIEARDKLLTRDGYGVITTAIIRESPVVGIGVGAFSPLVYLHSWQFFHRVIPADNAQNWFRHQFAELGALGSVGWLGWVVMFGGLLLTRRVDRRHLMGTVLRGLLIAFGLISLVGVPGQSVLVALMFWTFAFAFAGEAGRWRTEQPVATPSRPWWSLLWVLVAVYAAVMVYAGLTFLRPSLQAMRAGLNYASGFYPREANSPYSWTSKRAVAVVPVSEPWLELESIVNHPDAHENPVDVKVWVDGKLVVNRTVTSSYPIRASVKLDPGVDRVMIETWVSRVNRPSDFGGDDRRKLGMAIGWKFVERPGT